MYIERDLLLEINPCDHGGQQVQNLQCELVDWRLKRVDVPLQVQRQSAIEARGASVVDESEGDLLANSLSPGRGWSSCSGQAFRWLHGAHPHSGGQCTYSRCTDLNANLIETSGIVFDHIHKHLVAQPSWHIKLTIAGILGLLGVFNTGTIIYIQHMKNLVFHQI